MASEKETISIKSAEAMIQSVSKASVDKVDNVSADNVNLYAKNLKDANATSTPQQPQANTSKLDAVLAKLSEQIGRLITVLDKKDSNSEKSTVKVPTESTAATNTPTAITLAPDPISERTFADSLAKALQDTNVKDTFKEAIQDALDELDYKSEDSESAMTSDLSEELLNATKIIKNAFESLPATWYNDLHTVDISNNISKIQSAIEKELSTIIEKIVNGLNTNTSNDSINSINENIKDQFTLMYDNIKKDFSSLMQIGSIDQHIEELKNSLTNENDKNEATSTNDAVNAIKESLANTTANNINEVITTNADLIQEYTDNKSTQTEHPTEERLSQEQILETENEDAVTQETLFSLTNSSPASSPDENSLAGNIQKVKDVLVKGITGTPSTAVPTSQVNADKKMSAKKIGSSDRYAAGAHALPNSSLNSPVPTQNNLVGKQNDKQLAGEKVEPEANGAKSSGSKGKFIELLITIRDNIVGMFKVKKSEAEAALKEKNTQAQVGKMNKQKSPVDEMIASMDKFTSNISKSLKNMMKMPKSLSAGVQKVRDFISSIGFWATLIGGLGLMITWIANNPELRSKILEFVNKVGEWVYDGATKIIPAIIDALSALSPKALTAISALLGAYILGPWGILIGPIAAWVMKLANSCVIVKGALIALGTVFAAYKGLVLAMAIAKKTNMILEFLNLKKKQNSRLALEKENASLAKNEELHNRIQKSIGRENSALNKNSQMHNNLQRTIGRENSSLNKNSQMHNNVQRTIGRENSALNVNRGRHNAIIKTYNNETRNISRHNNVLRSDTKAISNNSRSIRQNIVSTRKLTSSVRSQTLSQRGAKIATNMSTGAKNKESQATMFSALKHVIAGTSMTTSATVMGIAVAAATGGISILISAIMTLVGWLFSLGEDEETPEPESNYSGGGEGGYEEMGEEDSARSMIGLAPSNEGGGDYDTGGGSGAAEAKEGTGNKMTGILQEICNYVSSMSDDVEGIFTYSRVTAMNSMMSTGLAMLNPITAIASMVTGFSSSKSKDESVLNRTSFGIDQNTNSIYDSTKLNSTESAIMREIIIPKSMNSELLRIVQGIATVGTNATNTSMKNKADIVSNDSKNNKELIGTNNTTTKYGEDLATIVALGIDKYINIKSKGYMPVKMLIESKEEHRKIIEMVTMDKPNDSGTQPETQQGGH